MMEKIMNKENSKKKRIIIIALIIIGLATVVVFLMQSGILHRIYGKLYKGNHIELDLSIYYDGELIPSDNIQVTCINPEGKNELLNNDDLKYSIKGGEYSKYIFAVTIQDTNYKEPVILELEFLNANDWYISNSNCIIEIQNQDGQLNCNYKISTEYNDKKIEDVYDNKQMEDRKIKISWGI